MAIATPNPAFQSDSLRSRLKASFCSMQQVEDMPIKNKKEWNSLLAKARKGDPDAQWEVGYYYEEGIFTNSGTVILEPQHSRALHWYTLSAQQNHASSQIALGNLLSTGNGIKRDIEAAIFWTKQVIKQGSSSAAHNLGTIYRDLNNPTLSFNWYRRAVDMGNLDSQFQVGLCYLLGYGTKTDYKAAHNCFKQILMDKTSNICERTIEDASYWSGIIHLLGIGDTKRSVKKARILFEEANKDDDHEQANEILNLIGKKKYLIA